MLITLLNFIISVLDTLSLDDEALNNSIVSLQDVLLDDQDVIIDYDRLSADTNFSDDKSLGDVVINCNEDGEDISSSCNTLDLEKSNTEDHLKVFSSLLFFKDFNLKLKY